MAVPDPYQDEIEVKLIDILLYFGGALLQHSIVFVAVWFIPVPFMLKAVIGVGLFTIAHLPNVLLVGCTVVLSGVYYPLTVLGFERGIAPGIGVLLIMALTHAVGGSYLKWRGVEMRVLWLHPKWRGDGS